MKNQLAPKTVACTEALLDGLIAECHAIIRDELIPTLRTMKPMDQRSQVFAVTDLMTTAVKLGDAVGRLRGTAPTPEIRQRIAAERVKSLPAPKP
jgi:hypothetical protein